MESTSLYIFSTALNHDLSTTFNRNFDRDEAQGKMMALKEKADKDLAQYNTELKELMRIIEHDRKLKDFMRIKSEERAEIEGEMSNQRKKKDEKEKGDKAEETIEVRRMSLVQT